MIPVSLRQAVARRAPGAVAILRPAATRPAGSPARERAPARPRAAPPDSEPAQWSAGRSAVRCAATAATVVPADLRGRADQSTVPVALPSRRAAECRRIRCNADTAGSGSGGRTVPPPFGARAGSVYDDVGGIGGRHQVRVDLERSEHVGVQQSQPGAEVLRAQLRRFRRGRILQSTDRTADEVDRVREVGQREGAGVVAGVWTVDVVAVGECVRRDVQDVLQRHLAVDQDLGDVGQTLDLFGGRGARARDESLDLDDRHRQVVQRAVQIRSAVVEHAGQRRQPILELHDLGVAALQRRDEYLQVLDDV